MARLSANPQAQPQVDDAYLIALAKQGHHGDTHGQDRQCHRDGRQRRTFASFRCVFPRVCPPVSIHKRTRISSPGFAGGKTLAFPRVEDGV